MNYTCIYPTESIAYSHFTSIHSNSETNANFFYDLSGWRGQFVHDSESLGSLGVSYCDFSYCKSHSPGYDNIPNYTYFRAKRPSGFPASLWYWHCCCIYVTCVLMLQLRTLMKRHIPCVSYITSMHVCLNRDWAALLFKQVFFSSAFPYLFSVSNQVASNSTAWAHHMGIIWWVAHTVQSCPSRWFSAN